MRILIAVTVVAILACLLVAAQGRGLPLQRPPQPASGLHRMKTERNEPRRTPLELAAIAVFSAACFILGFSLLVGLPAVAIMRAAQHGATISGVLWGTFAVLFTGIVLQAIIRDRETRGWIVFLTFGWLGVFPAIARAVPRWPRVGKRP